MGLRLNDIDKVVAGEYHLQSVSLEMKSDVPNVLLGRTLAGKTSLLRIMAGLDKPSRGSVIIDGLDVTGVSVRKRSVAMVYQQFINYPSLLVYDNIASPLKIAGIDKATIDRKVLDIAKMLHIDDLLDRLPAELSGGQQQRTAIARALVKEAQILLMDEPLVNLDYKLREELRVELREIFKRRKAVVVYTTTEPTEALMLGGHVAVIDEGRVLQTGKTTDVYHHPATMKVAEVFSDPPINYLEGGIHDRYGNVGRDVRFPVKGRMAAIPPGDYLIGIRSNHLSLNKTGHDDIEIDARVELSEINGSETFIHVKYGESNIVVQEDGVHSFRLGKRVKIHVNPRHFYIYNPSGQLVISPSTTDPVADPE